MTDDSLLSLLRAPAFIERTVRATLVEAISVRREFGITCDVRSFVQLALVRSRSIPEAIIESGDALARHELEVAVVRASAFFASSPLGKRLRGIAVERFVAAPPGIDLAIVDRLQRVHFVRLETYAGTEARLEAVAREVRAMDRLRLGTRASLHFFSLRDGTLRSYPAADTGSCPATNRAQRKVA